MKEAWTELTSVLLLMTWFGHIFDLYIMKEDRFLVVSVEFILSRRQSILSRIKVTSVLSFDEKYF